MSDAQHPTSVQEAREKVDREAQYLGIEFISTAEENAQVDRYEKALDALIAAVRAERDAEILRVVERMKAVYPPSLQREATLDAVLTIISNPEE